MREPTNYIYVIGREEGPIKVGITNALTSRLSSLQTGCPFPIKILYVMPCDSRDHALSHERTFHKVHESVRLAGEWFDVDAEMAINEIWGYFDYESWERHINAFKRRA